MRFLLCLVLLAGCMQHNSESYQVDSKYRYLRAYIVRYNVDMTKCTDEKHWQDWLKNYSDTHGPMFNTEELKEYRKYYKEQKQKM